MSLRRELLEDEKRRSVDEVQAPKCPACERPVRDQDWDRHRYEVHADPKNVMPYGKPDAREAVFVGPTPDSLDRKVAAWRALHPGVQLRLLGSGKDRDRNLLFLRYRIHDAQGRPGR